jgi:hypothetical protein
LLISIKTKNLIYFFRRFECKNWFPFLPEQFLALDAVFVLLARMLFFHLNESNETFSNILNSKAHDTMDFSAYRLPVCYLNHGQF